LSDAKAGIPRNSNTRHPDRSEAKWRDLLFNGGRRNGLYRQCLQTDAVYGDLWRPIEVPNMLNMIEPVCAVCGTQLSISYKGTEAVPSIQCDECGTLLHHVDGDFPVVDRLLARSKRELEAGDWTIPIVLDAIACESLIASLNKKWTLLPKGIPGEITRTDEEVWDQEFRGLRTVAERLNDSSRLMVCRPFDEYVQKKLKANAVFRNNFKLYEKVSPISCFQEGIFVPRNRIVHWGFINSTEKIASECHTHAQNLIRLLLIMDREKYEAFDKSLRKSTTAL
jgi:hypothetical protein